MAEEKNRGQGRGWHGEPERHGETGKESGKDRERTSEIGRKGGEQKGGNFANDPERAREAGRKGGESSGGGKR